jgi:hypothetical protein
MEEIGGTIDSSLIKPIKMVYSFLIFASRKFFIAALFLCSYLCAEDPFLQDLFEKVHKQFDYYYHFVESSKERGNVLLCELEKTGIVQKASLDQTDQLLFANIERIILDLLASYQEEGEIEDLVGIIHEPLPPLALCSELQSGGKEEGIKSKAEIFKSYLDSEAILYMCYPHGAKELRSEDEQKLYEHNLKLYFQNLFDRELFSEEFLTYFQGATFLFEKNQKQFAFCIHFPSSSSEAWAIFLGDISENMRIKKRVDEIADYLQKTAALPIPEFCIASH